MRTIPLPESLDALLLTNSVNIRYITGFVGLAPEEREAFALITKTKTYLFTHGLYELEAIAVADGKKLVFIKLSFDKPVSTAIDEIAKTQKIKKLGIESHSLTVAEQERLTKQLTGISLVSTSDIIEQVRMIKTPDEIESLRNAAKLTDDCFSLIQTKILFGVSEMELAWEITSFFHRNHATDSFPPIVAFNDHSAIPHAVPTNKKLENNSSILFDFGGCIDGYHADMTRVVFFGTPTSEWKKAYQTVLKSNMDARTYIETTKNPMGSKADEIARKVIEDAGFPTYPHSLGHSVGLAIHEAPRLSIHSEEILETGTVFTIEPGIYLDGKFGIRIEDLVVKTEKGLELLSHSPYYVSS